MGLGAAAGPVSEQLAHPWYNDRHVLGIGSGHTLAACAKAARKGLLSVSHNSHSDLELYVDRVLPGMREP